MRAPRPPPLDKGPDRRTGLRRHRRDFRRPELSFLVSETRTGAGRGREGRRALGAARSYGGPHSPPGAGPGAWGRGGWGLALGAARGSAPGEGSVGARPRRARRPVSYHPGLGAAGERRGSLRRSQVRRLPLPRSGTRKCKGAGRCDLTQVPAPVSARPRPGPAPT